jgi:hypothetical protein
MVAAVLATVMGDAREDISVAVALTNGNECSPGLSPAFRCAENDHGFSFSEMTGSFS